MKRVRGYLTSRFGRRVFVLFIAVVVTPVAIAAFVAIANLEHELRQQAGARLHQSAKEYGLSLLQRLTAVKREAALIEDAGAVVDSHELPFRVVADNFDRLAARADSPLDPATLETWTTSRPLLFTANARERSTIYVIFHDEDPPMALAVDPHYVWGPADYLPLPDICVTGPRERPLYCSTTTAYSLLALSNEPSLNRSTLQIELDHQTYLGHARELFLPSEFAASEWTVHVFQPEEQALSPARPFKYLFIPAIVAMIAGTLLLGVVQIRRRLQPLDRLVEGTQRVANQDFSTRIEVRSGDEFEDLAGAFNNMTRNLGRHIGTLRILSRIDKTILRTLDFEIVSSHVLTGLNELTPNTCATVTALDQDSSGQGQIYIIKGTSGDIEKIRSSIEFGDIDWTRHRDVIRMDLQDDSLRFLDPIRASGASSCFAVPFFSEEQLDGVLCLGLSDTASLDSETRKAMGDFSDRLAVAAAAIKKERQLQKQANFDSLTGLPNRVLLRDRLDRSIIRARITESAIAVLFLDLDRFKMVNDTMGHTSGDDLLVEAAERLVSCVDEGDTVARLSGDEFVILAADFDSENDVIATANRILEKFAIPFKRAEREILLGASIGIALFPQDGEGTEELLRNADTAMYEAKGSGRGRYFFFDHSMNQKLKRQARMESDLWRAVHNDELELWYQPQMDLIERSVTGVEALIRWRHPERGIVCPDDFIPLAEQLGLIDVVGSRVLNLACRDFLRWQKEGFALDRVAINVSPREFTQRGYVSRLAETLRQFDMPPLHLVLEIIENLLIHDTEMISRQLDELKKLGVSFSIDDFGIGYSSLSYLQRLPIDTLKIDRSFIREVTTNPESKAIVSAILDMARRLDLSVVAEGVETNEQLNYLIESGCKQIQGFFYSEALHPDEFVAFLKSYTV